MTEETSKNGSEAAPDAASEGKKPSREILDSVQRVIGEIALFMGERDPWRHSFLSDIHWQVLPPVLLGQYKLIRNSNDDTVGYVSWAMANAEVEARMLGGETRLKPSEWKGGDRALVVQLVCPVSGRDQVLQRVKQDLFADASLRVVERDGATGKPELREVKA